jgi:DUF4097 and DUF4098 domain-containing protein YvlB
VARFRTFASTLLVAVTLASADCDAGAQLGQPSEQDLPDGIDPRNPNTERTTSLIDFSGVRTIRIEIPTGSVSVSQSNDNGQASLKVTEVILAKGLSNEALAEKLNGSAATAARSFVDGTRLDIEATLAAGLADADISFDIRLVIPSSANVEIVLAHGQVAVTNLSGNVEIHTADGPVNVSGLVGNLVAVTTLQPIDISDVAGNVRVETSAADVTMRLAPPATGVLSAKTSEGVIRMSIAQATTASLSLSAPEGTITTNLSGFSISNLSTGDGFLTGILNGGGGQIEATAPKGSIEFVGI